MPWAFARAELADSVARKVDHWRVFRNRVQRLAHGTLDAFSGFP